MKLQNVPIRAVPDGGVPMSPERDAAPVMAVPPAQETPAAPPQAIPHVDYDLHPLKVAGLDHYIVQPAGGERFRIS